MQIIAPYDNNSGKRTIAEAMRELHLFRVAWFEHFGYPDLSVIRRSSIPVKYEEKEAEVVEPVELPKKRKTKRVEA